jgi:hypothetical protein
MTSNITTLALMVNDYIRLREDRLSLERQAEAIKEKETELKAGLIEALATHGANGVAGATHRVTLRKKSVPQVQDWSKLYEYILQNEAFDLLQRRLSAPAVVERWDDKKEVAGVVAISVTDLGINKI